MATLIWPAEKANERTNEFDQLEEIRAKKPPAKRANLSWLVGQLAGESGRAAQSVRFSRLARAAQKEISVGEAAKLYALA